MSECQPRRETVREFSGIAVMHIGIIGERYNYITYCLLTHVLSCPDVELAWFVDAEPPDALKLKLYGKPFKYGPIVSALVKIRRFIGVRRSLKAVKMVLHLRTSSANHHDSKALCKSRNIPYIEPKDRSVNSGLPTNMYNSPEADYVLIAGCDQLLDANGLKLGKKAIINYHWSPLPAYRGKFALFWQWYNREPYIGYTFHEVDLDVDTGRPILQGKVKYDPDEPLHQAIQRVVTESANQVCMLFQCLANNTEKLLNDGDIKSSFFPSRRYLDLITINPSKNLNQALNVSRKLKLVKLENGLTVNRIICSGREPKRCASVESDGIIVPLADGFIKVMVQLPIPFWMARVLLGKRMLVNSK